jgi:hypothetical protein
VRLTNGVRGLEQRLEAVLAIEPAGLFGAFFDALAGDGPASFAAFVAPALAFILSKPA